jgi:tetratricopeptide (TPR) repeat protein
VLRVLLLAAFAVAARSQPPADSIQTEIDAVKSARQAGDFAGAAAHRDAARRLVEAAPLAENMEAVANLYLEAERTAEGRAILRRAIAANPRSERLRFLLADSLEGEGNLAEAAAVLQNATGKEARIRLNGINRRLGRPALELDVTGQFPYAAADCTARDEALSPAQTAVIEARARLREGRTDDAFVLGLQAIASGSISSDTYIFNSVPALARMLARANTRGMADQLWDRLFAVAGDRSIDTLEPLLSLAREYARYLMQFPDRVPAARIALTRYRDLLVTAHGPESGTLAQVLRMTIEFEQDHEPETAAMAARQLLELEESLSGPDSLPMRHAAEIVAGLRQMRRR